MIEEVKLSAAFRNDTFQSWKVSDSLLVGKTQRSLAGSLYQPPIEAVDFLHANAAARHNALYPLERSVAVLTTVSEGLELWELKVDEMGRSCDDWSPVAKCIPVTTPSEHQIGLPPSLVEAGPTGGNRVLLLSTGKGDLALIDDAKTGVASIGWPLASNDGKDFVPFSLLSGWKGEAGQVICIICTVMDRSCESWVITVTPSGDGQDICAREKLQVHSEPPFFARFCLNDDSILLAGSPLQTESRTERKGLGASDVDGASCPLERWTDVYNESGPDDLGCLGQESPCVIWHWKRCSTGQGYVKEKEVVCHPYGYLSQCSSSQYSLLGLADDVDMAIVEPGIGEASGLQVLVGQFSGNKLNLCGRVLCKLIGKDTVIFAGVSSSHCSGFCLCSCRETSKEVYVCWATRESNKCSTGRVTADDICVWEERKNRCTWEIPSARYPKLCCRSGDMWCAPECASIHCRTFHSHKKHPSDLPILDLQGWRRI